VRKKRINYILHWLSPSHEPYAQRRSDEREFPFLLCSFFRLSSSRFPIAIAAVVFAAAVLILLIIIITITITATTITFAVFF